MFPSPVSQVRRPHASRPAPQHGRRPSFGPDVRNKKRCYSYERACSAVDTDVRDVSSAGGCAETETVSLIDAGDKVTCTRSVWTTLNARFRCSKGANPVNSTRRTYTL